MSLDVKAQVEACLLSQTATTAVCPPERRYELRWHRRPSRRKIGSNCYVKSRYPCSRLASVAVFQCLEGFQEALIREGRPPAFANAPFSRERS